MGRRMLWLGPGMLKQTVTLGPIDHASTPTRAQVVITGHYYGVIGQDYREGFHDMCPNWVQVVIEIIPFPDLLFLTLLKPWWGSTERKAAIRLIPVVSTEIRAEPP